MVSELILGLSFNARDTVEWDIPSCLAISVIVTYLPMLVKVVCTCVHSKYMGFANEKCAVVFNYDVEHEHGSCA